jgi:hypothetical protein
VSKFERVSGVTYKIAVSKGTLNSKSLYFNEKGQLQKTANIFAFASAFPEKSAMA